MANLKRFLILVPLVLSIVSIVLTSLALFAGQKDGFMEDYAIVRVNTSMIGQNLFESDSKSDKDKEKEKEGSKGGLLDKFRDKIDDIKDDVKGIIDDIASDLVGDLADKLGVSDWYSVHIMDACQGDFTPNGTASSPRLKVKNCTDSSPAVRLNLNKILNHELEIGPFDLNLAKIDWPDSIQDNLDIINNALLALFIFYALGISFSGLGILCCFPAFLIPDKKIIILINTAVASLGAFSIFIGSAIVTAASSIGVKAINKAGHKVGIVAERGVKFYAITWVAATLMIISTGFWVGQLWLLTRRRKRQDMFSKEMY